MGEGKGKKCAKFLRIEPYSSYFQDKLTTFDQLSMGIQKKLFAFLHLEKFTSESCLDNPLTLPVVSGSAAAAYSRSATNSGSTAAAAATSIATAEAEAAAAAAVMEWDKLYLEWHSYLGLPPLVPSGNRMLLIFIAQVPEEDRVDNWKWLIPENFTS